MSQTYDAVAGTDLLSASRSVLTTRDDALRSNFAGTSHAASPVEGQLSYRSDTDTLYVVTNATGPVYAQIPLGVPVPVAQGGTASTTAAAARTALGIGTVGTLATVATANIDDLAITTAKLANLAVTAAKIANATITATQLASNAVETAKILDLAVTAGKLAAGAAVSNIGYTPANKAGETYSGLHTFDAAAWSHRYTSDLAIGPIDYFEHVTASPAGSDIPYTRIVRSRNSAAAVTDYYIENFVIADPTAGTMDGERWQYLMVAGVATLIKKTGTGEVHGAASGGMKGVGTANFTAAYDDGEQLLVETPTIVCEDQQSTGTEGGTFTSGSYVTRVLNTKTDPASLGTLSSNALTLPAGRWLIEWDAPAMTVNGHQSRLYNQTDSAVVAYGSSEVSTSTATTATRSRGSTIVTITSSKAYRIEHRCGTTRSTDGLGKAAGFGNTEVYARMVARRIKI